MDQQRNYLKRLNQEKGKTVDANDKGKTKSDAIVLPLFYRGSGKRDKGRFPRRTGKADEKK